MKGGNIMLELLKRRRSIRLFEDKKVQADMIDGLVKAALLAPTSKNNRPWEFIVVEDHAMLEKLAESKPHGATFLKNAPLGIIVLADPAKSDVWVEDTSIATILVQMAAEAMGLGSCWIQIRERQHNDEMSAEAYIQKLMNIPSNIKVEAIIAIGHPRETKNPIGDEELQFDKVYREQYGKAYKQSPK